MWWAYQRLEARMGGGAEPDEESNVSVPISIWNDESAVAGWDVLLCPDFDARLMDLAQYAQHGLWWISTDPHPARTPDARCELGAMLQASGPFRTSLWRVRRGNDTPEQLETVSVRQVSSFSRRANLAALAPLRRQLWLATLSRLQCDGTIAMRSADTEDSKARAVNFAGAALARMVVRQFRVRRRLRNRIEAWQVGVRPLRDSGALFHDTAGYRWLDAPKDSWLADPCPIVVDGRTWLFVEKYDAQRSLGEICCCEVRGDGTIGPLMDVLRKPYHLSYPHIFCHEGEIFMVPETGANNTVELYRAADFPLRWELVRVLYRGPAFDTTVLHYNDRFWFFTSIADGPDHVASQLSLFESTRPDGDWCMHPASPLSMDARWSRCAGRVFLQDGRLIRPAQDCSRIYGGAISFREIVTLNEREYQEKVAGAITPATWAQAGAIGVHTYDRVGPIEVIDRLMSWREG